MTRHRNIKMRLPLETQSREGDSERMISAIEVAVNIVGSFVRPTAYQLKVQNLNFYPDNGTIVIDGASRKLSGQTADDFRKLLSEIMTRG